MTKAILTSILLLSTVGLHSFREPHTGSGALWGSKPASSYSSEVLANWMNIQIRLMSSTPAQFNGPFVRVFSYSGIVAFQAIAPGLTENSRYRIPTAAFSYFPGMPEPDPVGDYYWPASVNAALAFINRLMFPSTDMYGRKAIDSLENLLMNEFTRQADPKAIERSVVFGRDVARRIFEWAEMDGYKFSNAAYAPPSGPGKWKPTPPNYAKASTPFWGNLRVMVEGSIEASQPLPPPPYSEDSSSAFYLMNKEVYDASQSLDEKTKEMVLFWKDINPGFSAPGHWLNILRQVILRENTRLDKAAYAYALTGACINDAWISCWKTRYQYNLLRPVTYIREVMEIKDWNSFLVTPPHPEYTSGFAALAGAAGEALAAVFGERYSITDHSYDHLGMRPRKFSSFSAMVKEAGDSKFYAGIHFRVSCERGVEQGKTIAKNISALLRNSKPTARP